MVRFISFKCAGPNSTTIRWDVTEHREWEEAKSRARALMEGGRSHGAAAEVLNDGGASVGYAACSRCGGRRNDGLPTGCGRCLGSGNEHVALLHSRERTYVPMEYRMRCERCGEEEVCRLDGDTYARTFACSDACWADRRHWSAFRCA